MTLWARIQSFFSTGINAAISKAEDPEKLVELLLVEMESNYRAGRERLMACLAEEKRAEKRQEEEQEAVRRYEEEATRALQNGEADTAAAAVERKCVHQLRGECYGGIRETHQGNAAAIKKALEALSRQMKDARDERALLLAEKREAGNRAGQERVLKQLQNREPTDTLNRLLEAGRSDRPLPLKGAVASSSERAVPGNEVDGVLPDVSVDKNVVYDELARLKSLLDDENEKHSSQEG